MPLVHYGVQLLLQQLERFRTVKPGASFVPHRVKEVLKPESCGADTCGWAVAPAHVLEGAHIKGRVTAPALTPARLRDRLHGILRSESLWVNSLFLVDMATTSASAKVR